MMKHCCVLPAGAGVWEGCGMYGVQQLVKQMASGR
jgi:hypothetical protein